MTTSINSTHPIPQPLSPQVSPLQKKQIGINEIPSLGLNTALPYRIIGDDMPILELLLQPGEIMTADKGSMLYRSSGIKMDTKAAGGIGKAIKRSFGGESIFMPQFTNVTNTAQHLGISPGLPGRIIPIDLAKFGGSIMCQKGVFLAGDAKLDITAAFTKKISAGFFGGEGFIMQKIQGQGKLFLHAGGTIVKKDLRQGEELQIDTGSLVAMSPSIKYSVARAGGTKSMFFGGEGVFNTKLTGPGTVYIQSLPASRLAENLYYLQPKPPRTTSSSGFHSSFSQEE